MDRQKILQAISLEVLEEHLVVKYRDKTLGRIPVDWSQLTGPEGKESIHSAPKENQPSIKQYVEGCDMGWC